MRLFTAIIPPVDLIDHCKLFRGGLPDARWTDESDFHITLRFFGAVNHHQASQIDNLLQGVKQDPIEITLTTLSSFGGKKPHSVWLGIEHNKDLTGLVQTHERIAQTIDLKPNSRKFMPHVTLGRLKGTTPEALATWISAFGQIEQRTFIARQFALMSAREPHGGAPYLVEALYSLENAQ